MQEIQKKVQVSVITPVFNAERFLPRLFNSVKSQHGVSFEHILVDDASTDNSLAVMQRFAARDSRIKVISFSKNVGPVVARNRAIEEARGKFLAFLDADDYWLPSKLLIQSEFMEASGAALSFTDYRFISESGELVGRRLRGFSQVGWSLHHITRHLGCLTIMINQEICGNFFFPNISPSYRAEDFLAWSRVILLHGPALRCKHDLARYAVVSNSRSSNAVRAAKSVWLLYRDVEKIPFSKAIIYFCSYCLLTLIKRWWLSPRNVSNIIEPQIADLYLLRNSND